MTLHRLFVQDKVFKVYAYFLTYFCPVCDFFWNHLHTFSGHGTMSLYRFFAQDPTSNIALPILIFWNFLCSHKSPELGQNLLIHVHKSIYITSAWILRLNLFIQHLYEFIRVSTWRYNIYVSQPQIKLLQIVLFKKYFYFCLYQGKSRDSLSMTQCNIITMN